MERDARIFRSSILTDTAVLAQHVHPQSCIATLVHPVTQSEMAHFFQFKFLRIYCSFNCFTVIERLGMGATQSQV